MGEVCFTDQNYKEMIQQLSTKDNVCRRSMAVTDMASNSRADFARRERLIQSANKGLFIYNAHTEGRGSRSDGRMRTGWMGQLHVNVHTEN